MDINIRIANNSDLENLTILHCNSFTADNHIPMIFGKSFIKSNYKWLLNSGKSYVLVAEYKHEIIGLIAVSDIPFTRPMFLASCPQMLISLIRRPWIILNKKLWKRVFRLNNKTQSTRSILRAKGFAQMTIGAISNNHRGSGVFGMLVDAARINSKSRGSLAIRAGVYKVNTSSRKVFIKSNWQEFSQLETKDTVFYVTCYDKDFSEKYGLNFFVMV
jgi:hypothetical protein